MGMLGIYFLFYGLPFTYFLAANSYRAVLIALVVGAIPPALLDAFYASMRDGPPLGSVFSIVFSPLLIPAALRSLSIRSRTKAGTIREVRWHLYDKISFGIILSGAIGVVILTMAME